MCYAPDGIGAGCIGGFADEHLLQRWEAGEQVFELLPEKIVFN